MRSWLHCIAMPQFTRRTTLPFAPEIVDAWHRRPGAFTRLAPPWQALELLEHQGLDDGDVIRFRMGFGPTTLTWEGVHRPIGDGLGFIDFQTKGPFASWLHSHRFSPDDGGCRLTDSIEYSLPLGAIGACVAGGHVRSTLQKTFAFRHHRTLNDLVRHRDRAPMRVAITGASGLVGSALSGFLSTGGHEVWHLVRKPARPDQSKDAAARGAGHPASGPREIKWNISADSPGGGEIESDKLEGFDVIIHLAGESVAGRWSVERRERILASRVDGTGLLCRALAGLKQKPALLISASAVGIYGHRGEERIDEASSLGDGFLADVARAWESAADPAREAGIRVVHPRIGLVLSAAGGALGQMLPMFRLGLGGPLGTGDQAVPWISRDDLIGLLHWLMYAELDGPVNAVAPNPVSQATFASVLGQTVRRPALIPAPAFAVRTLLGEAGQHLALEGAYVQPNRAFQAGFEWLYPELRRALQWATGDIESAEFRTDTG